MAGTNTSATALAGAARRPAGSDAERRAANALAVEARDRGLTASTTSFSIWPRAGLPQALLTLAAIVGGLVATASPAPGAAVVAAATLLFVLDSAGIAQPVRHLFGRRVSQNVEIAQAAATNEKPGTLIIASTIDTPRRGGAMRRATRLLRDPWRATALAMAALLICVALRVAGLDATALTAVQFVPTVLLILLTPAYVDSALASPAEDPTAGSAQAALSLASELDLTYFNVEVLLTGATSASAAGMRRWLREHRRALDRATTAIVELDTTGPLAFTTRQGAVLSQRTHRDLLRLAREVAEDVGGAAEITRRETTNASRALARRLPAIGISAEAPDRLRTFARELIERLDGDLGSSLDD